MNNGHEELEYAVLIGIDWAHNAHAVCVREPDGSYTASTLEQSPEAIARWIEGLKARYPHGGIAIALEQSKGPLAYALMEFTDVVDIYPVNPRSLSSFRKTWAVSGAKDDPSDAQLLCVMLDKHRDRLVRWRPDEKETQRLQLLGSKRRKLVDLRSQMILSLTAVLKDYYPQALALIASELHHPISCDFIVKWPTFDDLKRARRETILSFYYRHNSRSRTCIEKRLDLIEREVPLTTNDAIVEPSKMMAVALAKQIIQINTAIRQFDKTIAEAFKAHPDAFIFKNLPGAGAALAPRLLSVFGEDRERWADASSVQKHSGIAPVIERSGKTTWVHRRFACPRFERQTFHEFAGSSIVFSRWARAYYDLQRSRGKGHQAAVRALAFKWIRVIFACWKDRAVYDEETYIKTLKERGSPMMAFMPQIKPTTT